MDENMLAIKAKLKEVIEHCIPIIEESIKYYKNKPNPQGKIEKLQTLCQCLLNNYAMQVPQVSITYLIRAEKVGQMLKDKYSVYGAEKKKNNSAAGIATQNHSLLAKTNERKSTEVNHIDISACSAVHKLKGIETGRLLDDALPCPKLMSLNTKTPLGNPSPCPKLMNSETPLDNSSQFTKQMSLNIETALADTSCCSKLMVLNTKTPSDDPPPCPKLMPLNIEIALADTSSCPKLVSLNTKTPSDDPSSCPKLMSLNTKTPSDDPSPCPKLMPLNIETAVADTSSCPNLMSLNTKTPSVDPPPCPKLMPLNTEMLLDNTSPFPKRMSLNVETALADTSSCLKLMPLNTKTPSDDPSSCSKLMPLNIETALADMSSCPKLKSLNTKTPSEDSPCPKLTPLDTETTLDITSPFPKRMSLNVETDLSDTSSCLKLMSLNTETPLDDTSPCPKLMPLNTETPLDEVPIRPKLIASNAMEALLPEEWKKTPNFLIPQCFEVGPLRVTLCSSAPVFSCRECLKYSASDISVLRLHFYAEHRSYVWDGLCLICGYSTRPSRRSHSLSAVLVHLLRHVLIDTASPLTAFWDELVEDSQNMIEENKIGSKKSRKRPATVGDARKSVEEIMTEMYEESTEEEGLRSESGSPPKISRPFEMDIFGLETVEGVIRMLED